MASIEQAHRGGLRLLKAFAGVLLAAGLLLIIFAVRAEFVARHLDLIGVRTTGSVIAIINEGDDQEAPRVRFTTATGRTVIYTGSPSANGAAGQVGDTVPVFYDPADPETAWRNINGYYAGPIIPGGIGIVLAGLGTMLLFFKPRLPAVRREARAPLAQETPFPVFAETPKPVRLFFRFIACLMIAGGCASLGFGIFLGKHTHDAVASKLRAIGTVVEFVKPRLGEVAPRVEFVTAAGQHISFIGDASDDDTDVRKVGAYSVGDSVTVLYDDAAPDAAQAYSFADFYLGPIWAGAIGLFLLGCGWFLFVQQRPRPLPRTRTMPPR